MKRRLLLPVAVLAACLAVVAPTLSPSASSGAAPRAPAGFFGITPQSIPTAEDIRYMKAGGIEVMRWPIFWNAIQPTRNGPYDWSSFDAVVGTAARGGMQVMPSIGTPPAWVARRGTTMPIDTAAQRRAWTAFLRAAVKRYGPGGEFWAQHAGVGYEPAYEPAITRPLPIQTWQIWNESNFFYFAFPVSPSRYARLLTISSQAIKGVQPRAKVILSGLFGKPNARGVRGMPAATFLERLYRVPGLKSRFDGIALHPYAVDTSTLEGLVERFHAVTVKYHDRAPMYITEMGWGSQNDPRRVAYEQGVRGQARELRASYRYLIANWRRLDLRQVYWYSWKDLRSNACDFCDSVGLFHAGNRMHPKPAWRAFVSITGGRARP
jgi:Beta-galactosidase